MGKYIAVPDTLAEILTDDEALILEAVDNGFSLKLESASDHNQQNFSLRHLFIPSLFAWLMGLMTFLVSQKSQISFTGNELISVANASSVFGILSGLVSFVLAYRKTPHARARQSWFTKMRETLTLALTYTLVTLAVTVIAFYVMRYTFNGVSFDPVTASLFVLAFSAIINFVLISSAMSVKVSNLITMLFVTFIGGVLVAMAMNNQRDWWRFNFSFLGTSEARTYWEFNLTLIFSGLILLTITDYLFSEFSRSDAYTKKSTVVRFFYYLIAVLIACVGIFPANDYSWTMTVHNLAAFGIVGCIMVLILLLRWLLPEISKEFLVYSAITLGLLVLSTFLFLGIHYLSLTFFEIIAFVIAFIWLVMLINAIQDLSQAHRRWQLKLVDMTPEETL
ncbi:DUF998 domain-containing protein [Pseudolactococcus reticulitermitis]|uniref:DUF998 domain-containing protein n=1 Tax=Pseudolactococcus reticulitermitis TaxID=2025039 RepID=A0A224WZX8_9LACT|nr:ABC transporter permease [Lactococcus reticulitermitis]GAX47588.1 hypothetical protein RsY01_1188 [Lactococcus reticulitermitis]